MPEIEGTLERITYRNEGNDFTVARLKAKPGSRLVTVVGSFPPVAPGETLKIKGEWINNPRYGYQFKAEAFEFLLPKTLKGVERFLGSGLIKGIGPATAKRLVEAFGKEVLDIIEKNPQRLCEVEGIGEKKAQAIARGYEEQQDIRGVMIFLQNYEVSPALAAKIYKIYGKETAARIKDNPYRLAKEVTGIGFKTADKIAMKLGLGPRSPYRIKAGVLYVLWEAAGQGHVFLPQKEVLTLIKDLFDQEEGDIEESFIMEQIKSLVEERELFLEEKGKGEEIQVYLAPFYHAEKGVAKKLLSLKASQQRMGESFKGDATDELALTPYQREALKKAWEDEVLIITGGPGTGKTTTIKALINMFERNSLEVSLAAPTGRAARRMTEAAGREAKTIHRLLEYGYSEGELKFKRDEDNPLKTKVLIVDEVSMVDLLLMYNLLKALPSSCKLVLVGDMDQLPSVGAGNVLRELIGSGALPVVTLNKIFRQAQESLIVVNAHRINQGKFPIINEKNKDFYFIQEEDPEKIARDIIDLCSYRLPSYLKVHPIRDIQVITPMRRTLLGVENLNRVLQGELNPPRRDKAQIYHGSEILRQGDKVMQVKNNYQKEVYNGDIGRIKEINQEDGEMTVTFPDLKGTRQVVYGLNELEELDLSYAISIHKSQGSEYPVVVVPVVTQHYILLQRNLLYTGITRAREMVVVIGSRKAMGIALGNNRVEERYTRLGERLVEGPFL